MSMRVHPGLLRRPTLSEEESSEVVGESASEACEGRAPWMRVPEWGATVPGGSASHGAKLLPEPRRGVQACLLEALCGLSRVRRRLVVPSQAGAAIVARSVIARMRSCAMAKRVKTVFTLRWPRTRSRCSPRLRARAFTHSAVAARCL
jgi:hypothetical protein